MAQLQCWHFPEPAPRVVISQLPQQSRQWAEPGLHFLYGDPSVWDLGTVSHFLGSMSLFPACHHGDCIFRFLSLLPLRAPLEKRG